GHLSRRGLRARPRRAAGVDRAAHRAARGGWGAGPADDAGAGDTDRRSRGRGAREIDVTADGALQPGRTPGAVAARREGARVADRHAARRGTQPGIGASGSRASDRIRFDPLGGQGMRALIVSRGWVQAAVLVFLFGFFVLGLLALRTYQEQPPIPERVVGPRGEVLFTGTDVLSG